MTLQVCDCNHWLFIICYSKVISEKTCETSKSINGTSSNHLKVFEELNILGEELLKANLQVKTVADNSK